MELPKPPYIHIHIHIYTYTYTHIHSLRADTPTTVDSTRGSTRMKLLEPLLLGDAAAGAPPLFPPFPAPLPPPEPPGVCVFACFHGLWSMSCRSSLPAVAHTGMHIVHTRACI